ncbi:MAG: crossover junction endodeoxyribonuclease RuvC [Thermodesulfobacteriota bacterium]|nr:crossover junction endodeoxyribonuclease RuvC [Thermodesulfobacteriota bacterium]
MIVLGIDPGTKVTGYGIVEKKSGKLTHVTYGEIRIKRGELLSQGLKKIYDSLMKIVVQFDPQAIAIENIFYGKNVQSLIKQAQARGVAILVASHTGIPIYEYTPLEVKKAVVGYGRAEKAQVQHMVKAILGLPELPPEDASDALAIAICHSNFQKVDPF